MFCENCGTQIKDGAKFCSACGVAVNNDLVLQETKVYCVNCGVEIEKGMSFCSICGIKINGDVENYKSKDKRKKNKRKFLIAACVFILLIIVVTSSIVLLSRRSLEAIANKYYVAIFNDDYDEFCECLAIDYDARADEFDYVGSDAFEDMISRFEYYYGYAKEIEINVLEIEKITQEEMEEEINSLKELYLNEGVSLRSFLDYKNINKMCMISGEINIDARDGEISEDFEMCCVKMNGEWFVLYDDTDLLY